MASVERPPQAVVVKVSRTPAMRSRLPRARRRASWKAQGLTRGWLPHYGDLKRTPGSTVAKDSASVCIFRIETARCSLSRTTNGLSPGDTCHWKVSPGSSITLFSVCPAGATETITAAETACTIYTMGWDATSLIGRKTFL